MKITIKTLKEEIITLEVEQTDTVRKIKERIQEIKGIHPDSQVLILGGQILKDDELLFYYKITEETTLTLTKNNILKFDENVKDGMIDFFDDDSKKQKNASEYLQTKLKNNELNVNLIHFDLNIASPENYLYYNDFNINVVGDFIAIDNLDILQEYLDKIQYKHISYVVITTGSSGKDVIPMCKKYSYIKEVIIFCQNYQYNKHYIDEYPGYVKKVLTKIEHIYEYIKSFKDEYKSGIEKYMEGYKYISSFYDRQLLQCPFITSYEYDKFGFLVHKLYVQFFGDILDTNDKSSLFKKENLNQIIEYISHLNFENEAEKSILTDKFNKLAILETNNLFIEQSIREYTSESSFCYLFNRPLRNFGKGLISFSYYMGPFLYGLNKYVKDNPKFAMSKKMELYKIIKCSRLEFYHYKLNLGHIICLTSLVSTSSSNIKYKPKEIKKEEFQKIEEDNIMIVKLKFKYIHQKGNISPGIVIENKKSQDGNYISSQPKEKEVLLFPFTFAKIKEITPVTENGINIHLVNFEIINRKAYNEYLLQDDFTKRMLYNPLEQS